LHGILIAAVLTLVGDNGSGELPAPAPPVQATVLSLECTGELNTTNFAMDGPPRIDRETVSDFSVIVDFNKRSVAAFFDI
jgi:hypothetical protein